MTTSPSCLNAHVALDQRVRADHQLDRARFDLARAASRRAAAPVDPVSSATRKRDACSSREMLQEVLLGQDLGRRHERHLQAVLHRDQRGQQRDDGLAGADVPLQQPVHRLRPLQVVDDLLQRLLLPRRSAGTAARARADSRMRSSTRIVTGFRSAAADSAPRQHAHLKEERLFEDQPPLRRRREPVQRARAARRPAENARPGAPRSRDGSPSRDADASGSGSGQIGRQPLQRVVDEPALHLRRDAAGPLVDRHDAARCGSSRRPRRRGSRTAGWSAAGRPSRASRSAPNSTTCWPRAKTSRRNGWFSHTDAQRAAAVADARFEDLEPGTPRRSQPAAQDTARDRGGLPRLSEAIGWSRLRSS